MKGGKMRKIILVSLLMLIVLISGCWQQAGKGTLVMQITDKAAEIDIEKALVTVSGIEVHKAGEKEEEEGNWFEAVKEAKTFDLITIKGVKEFLGTAELRAGKYTQVRLQVDKALVTIDGKEYDLTVPSDKLKLVREFEIAEGKTTTLTLDFDAKDSIYDAGKGDYKLKPTIKIIQE